MKELNEEPETWMSEGEAPSQDHDTKEPPEGIFRAEMTDEIAQVLLRNNWGSVAAGVFTKRTFMVDWLSLAWVENRFAPGTATERLIRYGDIMIHRLEFDIESNGFTTLVAHYAGRQSPLVVKLDALGGVTLPAANMEPADKNVFQGRTALLTRDPVGDNEGVPFNRIVLVIDRQVHRDYHMSEGLPDLTYGEVLVQLLVESEAADQMWNIVDQADAETPQDFRITITAPAPALTLQLDLHDVVFRVGAFGHEEMEYVENVSSGFPKRDSVGDFLDISIT